MVEKRKLTYLDERLCFALYSSSKAVVRLYQPYLDAIGITYLHYLILIVLIERGDQSVSQLGQNLFLNSGTLTPALKRMESLGLIERTRSKEDERIVLVSLTDKARGLKAAIAEMQFEVSCSVGLDRTTFQHLRDELKALNLRLRD